MHTDQKIKLIQKFRSWDHIFSLPQIKWSKKWQIKDQKIIHFSVARSWDQFFSKKRKDQKIIKIQIRFISKVTNIHSKKTLKQISIKPSLLRGLRTINIRGLYIIDGKKYFCQRYLDTILFIVSPIWRSWDQIFLQIQIMGSNYIGNKDQKIIRKPKIRS